MNLEQFVRTYGGGVVGTAVRYGPSLSFPPYPACKTDEELTAGLYLFFSLPSLPVCSKGVICFAASRGEADDIYVYYSEEASVGIKTMRK